ncbi:hypothetical protein SLS61_000665 [Didymella pomorum]
MSLTNEVHWGYIHDHFKNTAAQYSFSLSGAIAVEEPSSPLCEKCDSGFDGCGGFCVSPPDTNSNAEEECSYPNFMDEDILFITGL